MLTRAQLIDLVEHRYFGRMDKKQLDDVLACLTPECVWRIYPADVALVGRDGEIKSAFVDAMKKYETLWHGNFEWIVDEQNQRICATFDVRLVDADGQETKMSNAKIFNLSGEKFSQLDLYFSTVQAVIDLPH
ncbi:MAG: ketosteroid isomerase-like protein [Gammaproteobacteria bacterium]|jgi:ketosteroid isomerase-like protein